MPYDDINAFDTVGEKMTPSWYKEQEGYINLNSIFDIPVMDIAGNRIDFTYIVGSSNERPNTAVTSVTLDKTSCDLLVDETIQLVATVNPGIAANKNVTWTS